MTVATDHPQYAEWDAAYVLGALSLAERREFEDHLEGCDRCRAAVAELTALPGLLARVHDERAFSLLADLGDDADPLPVPPGLPVDLVARIRQREESGSPRGRGSRRPILLASLAAAAALAVALVVPHLVPPTGASRDVAVVFDQVVASPITADATLTTVGWGTRIVMDCSYAAAAGVGGADGYASPSMYSMWVVSTDGTTESVSSWNASEGTTARITAGTSIALADIASIEVRSATDTVLLTADLATS
jgi:hypothetical protein